MFVVIDLESEIPIYQQIRDRVIEGIADGALRPGSVLPSTRQLAADFGVNFHTVNKAYDLLRQEGVVRVNRKQGAVVNPESPPSSDFLTSWEARLRTLLAEAFVHGTPVPAILARCAAALATFKAPGSPPEEVG